MPARSSHSNNGHHVGTLSVCLPSPAPSLRTVPKKERRLPSDRDLEGWLSSALLVSDKELGNVVREVDEISSSLRSDDPPSESLRVAGHPAVWGAIRHVILERELRYLALTDDLTCLYNRRGFFAAATQQLKLARRNSQSLLLFFCDVDKLKTINDSYGHREGDLALVRAADVLEAAFRDSDILARLGGDEFAVLALDAGSQNQEMILHRLEQGLKNSATDDSCCELSLSVGVARFNPKCPVTLGELMAEADRSMYEQKRSRSRTSANND